MQDGQKKANKKSSSAQSSSGVAQADKGGDHSTEQLKRMGSKLGNEELQQRIQKGNATRDDLMDFLHKRLENMRGVQEREIGMSDARSTRENWRKIADTHKTDMTSPDPTRWRESAKLYEDAAYQLARGSLGRGTQLVQKAMDQEKKTFDQLTALVRVRAEEKEGLESGPAGGMDIAPNEACSATEVPSEVKALAHAIQNVTEKAPQVPGRRRVLDPWWTLEEEEEEEEGNAGSG